MVVRSLPMSCRFFILALAVVSCATVRPPEGGPVDTTPPEVVETAPPPNSTRFDGTSVLFWFSEWVERQSVENNLHISPIPPSPPEYEWSGKSFRVRFLDSLRSNTTYVFTLGTGIVDRNNRNPLAQSFILAFSTGDSLDQGSASGMVVDDKPAGISIFAYRAYAGIADTINPAERQPDYFVQTNANGEFRFRNIAPGMYRFFAIRDKIKNILYDAQTDEFGVSTRDPLIVTTDTLVRSIYFRMSIEDTTAPTIQSAESIDARRILIRFSEALRDSPVSVQWISVKERQSGSTIPLLSVTSWMGSRNQYLVSTAEALRDTEYSLFADSLADAAGNMIAGTGTSVNFIGMSRADTTGPRIVQTVPADASTGYRPDSLLHVSFSEPIDTGNADVSLVDSTNTRVPIRLSFPDPATMRIHHPPLEAGRTYTLCLDCARLKKMTNGIPVADTVACIRFATLGERDMGLLGGSTVLDPPDTTGIVYIEVSSVEGETRNKRYRTPCHGDGTFVFTKLPAGKYTLSAFVDGNGNGRFDRGKPYPFIPAERFGFIRDTLRVRAQWETRDVSVRIP